MKIDPKNIRQKKANRREIDTFYGICAHMSVLIDASGDEENDIPGVLVERAKLIPGGLRDLRCVTALVRKLVHNMIFTFDADKQKSIQKQINHLRIKTVFGPEASKDPEMFMLPTQDLAILVHAATQECKMLMCPCGDCSRCKLGKVLDSASFVSRDGRAWWEVFEQASRRDVGMEAV